MKVKEKWYGPILIALSVFVAAQWGVDITQYFEDEAIKEQIAESIYQEGQTETEETVFARSLLDIPEGECLYTFSVSGQWVITSPEQTRSTGGVPGKAVVDLRTPPDTRFYHRYENVVLDPDRPEREQVFELIQAPHGWEIDSIYRWGYFQSQKPACPPKEEPQKPNK